MAGCLCDAFLDHWITSTADGVRPPTWRPLAEHPGARFAPDLDCFRREHLILAFCTECARRWYFSWDLKDDCFHAVPLGDVMLETLNLDVALPRLCEYLVGTEYRIWNWALEGFVDRYFHLASYDPADAASRLRQALKTPGLRGDVTGSLTRRLARILDREARRAREARPHRRPPA